MPFTRIDFVFPLRVRMMFVPGDEIGGHGFVPPCVVNVRCHWTFLDLIVMRRASFAPRDTLPALPVPRSRSRVTST